MSLAARLAGSFYLKLVLVLLLLLGAVGTVCLGLVLHASNAHFEEVQQRLNRGVAEHLAAGLEPFAGDGIDQDALQALFMDVMKINPTLEVYLLDAEGRILAYDAPPEKVVRQRVALEPLRRFLEGRQQQPLRGDDPRHASRQKVFSAFALQEDGVPRGYLYAILGSEEYDSVVARLQGSYILRVAFWVGLGVLVVATSAGLAAFGILTRPLRSLRRAMEGFQQRPGTSRAVVRSRDEVGALATAFNEMADRIVAQMRRQRESDELRREMVANISHDLRTPLNAVQGYLETILLKEPDLSEEERRAYLGIALRNTERLVDLVRDLFELARLDAGEVRLSEESFPLQELVQDVVQKFELRARDRRVELRFRCAARLPNVTADIGLIERVIDNLVDNAIRFTPAGGVVAVSLREKGSQVEIRVTDTGPGIPAQDLPRIFERSYRVEKSRSEDSGGTGLGLAISKRILDLHRSPIEVRSRPSLGTAFSFTLST